jgi:predicted nucleic acid-binding protein
MKVVVADTSPLNYLILIGEVDLLARLYGEVLIPDLVAREMSDSQAPPLGIIRAAAIREFTDMPTALGRLRDEFPLRDDSSKSCWPKMRCADVPASWPSRSD